MEVWPGREGKHRHMSSLDSVVSSKQVVSTSRGVTSDIANSMHEADLVSSAQDADVIALERPVVRENGQVGLWNCLVASARLAQRHWLAEAARRWGWDVSVCSTPSDAARSIVRLSPQLAFVDLQRPEGEAFRELVSQIASECQTLLVVCGNEDDGKEEIWIRELGAWFYLPGIQPGASVALLFRDARTIVEKQVSPLLADGRLGEVLAE